MSFISYSSTVNVGFKHGVGEKKILGKLIELFRMSKEFKIMHEGDITSVWRNCLGTPVWKTKYFAYSFISDISTLFYKGEKILGISVYDFSGIKRICEILHSHSGVVEDSALLGRDAASLDSS